MAYLALLTHHEDWVPRRGAGCWGEPWWLLQVVKDSFMEAALGTPGGARCFADLSQANHQTAAVGFTALLYKESSPVPSSSACSSREHRGRPCPVLARGLGTPACPSMAEGWSSPVGLMGTWG